MLNYRSLAELVKIYKENPDPKLIAKAVEILRQGGLVIYPTDTVYGLGCDITKTKAIERIAQLKGIKLAKANFSFICPDLSKLSDYVRQIDTSTFKLLKRLLPGPYTFILPGSSNLPKAFKRKKTVGIRIPENTIAQALAKELGNPIVSTSIHDQDTLIEYTTDPELIFEKWKNHVSLVIDGGYGGNQASTVIDLSRSQPILLRKGKGSLEFVPDLLDASV